jgi:two-component system sensor histidine kinase CiaH
MAVRGGRLIVATSTREVASVTRTLLAIEAILAPILLLTLFAAATVVGRRAAAPVERARLRQLEFAADASHELRTPLSVIEAEVGLALSTRREADGYRSALERVAGETARLRGIVDDLLWLARLDAVPGGPAHEIVDLEELARAGVGRFTTLAEHRQLTMTFTKRGMFPALVLAPADWVERLISVILDNACRYVPSRGRIEVSVTAAADRVVLQVDDDGPGIAQDERARVLERFHRASALGGGAGLGLALADAVVQATGGEWAIAVAPIGGARIEVRWSRATGDPARLDFTL